MIIFKLKYDIRSMIWTDLALISLVALLTCHICETTARPSFRPLCIADACNRIGIIRPPFFVFETVPINWRTYSTLQILYSGSRSYRGGSDTHKSIENAVCDSIY